MHRAFAEQWSCLDVAEEARCRGLGVLLPAKKKIRFVISKLLLQKKDATKETTEAKKTKSL